MTDHDQTSCSYRFISSSLTQLTSTSDYEVTIRQQPSRAKMSVINERDRRPIDPPPILQMKWPHCSSEDTKMRLQSPFYFLVANLVDAENNDQLLLPAHNYLSGTTVSSLYRLRDLDNQDGGFYVFGDLSVKKSGIFKLQFSLFEIIEDRVQNQQTLLSESFTVYLPKNFPGPLEATFLSRTFCDQGVKMRIRKEHRLQSASSRKRKTAPVSNSHSNNNELSETTKQPDMNQSSKRKAITPSYAPPQSHQVHFGKFGSSPQPMISDNYQQQQNHATDIHYWTNHSSPVYPSPQSSTETKDQLSHCAQHHHHLSTPPSPTYTHPSPSMNKDHPTSSPPYRFSYAAPSAFHQPISPPSTTTAFHIPPPPVFHHEDHLWGSKLPPLRAIMTNNYIDHQDDTTMHERSFWQLPPIQFHQ